MRTVIVIGGGPAGMMAAGTAAQRGCKVLLFEKNESLGRKLLITGKGRCNLTNAADVEEMLGSIPGNPFFLYSALYSLDSFGLVRFFEELGVATKVERGNRVFPVSDKSGDVLRAMERFLQKGRVRVYLNKGVKKVHSGGVVTQDGEAFKGDAVIIATGGLSYPSTGSTGDGYRFAKQHGHSVTELHPSLVPLHTEEKWVAGLQGLSLKNIGMSAYFNKKKMWFGRGEMLFTHVGISGPLVLTASRQPVDTVILDLKPALDEKKLDKRILRDFELYSNKNFKNSLQDLLPGTMIPVLIALSGIDEDKKVHDITKEERKKIVHTMKNMQLTIEKTAGFNEAVVTRGGICVDEVDPSTMASKKTKGLYFAGEVLDVDGLTGGFNLQIAFSTGFLAGSSV